MRRAYDMQLFFPHILQLVYTSIISREFFQHISLGDKQFVNIAPTHFRLRKKPRFFSYSKKEPPKCQRSFNVCLAWPTET